MFLAGCGYLCPDFLRFGGYGPAVLILRSSHQGVVITWPPGISHGPMSLPHVGNEEMNGNSTRRMLLLKDLGS